MIREEVDGLAREHVDRSQPATNIVLWLVERKMERKKCSKHESELNESDSEIFSLRASASSWKSLSTLPSNTYLKLILEMESLSLMATAQGWRGVSNWKLCLELLARFSIIMNHLRSLRWWWQKFNISTNQRATWAPSFHRGALENKQPRQRWCNHLWFFTEQL